LLSNSAETKNAGDYNAEDTCPGVSSAIRAAQIETWGNPRGRDGRPHVDEHFLTSRNIG